MNRLMSFDGNSNRKEFFKTIFFITSILIAYAILLDLAFPYISVTSIDSIMSYKGPTSLALGVGIVSWWLLSLIAFVIRSAVAVRRCHDAGINANFVWLTFIDIAIPYAGWLVLIIIGCLPTKNQETYIKLEPTL
jgi:uncharacterized membrane protein YhaH (DUF805 family)